MAAPRFNGRTLVIDGLIVLALAVTVIVGLRGNSQKAALECDKPGQQHRVSLAEDRFAPQVISIARCDTVVIENNDQTLSYNLNFGSRDSHQVYPGYRASTIIPGESITLDAFAAGKYQLHDHFRDTARLDLTISN